MSKTADQSHALLFPEHQSEPKPEEIRLQLQVILDSPAFHGSKRSRQFLGYVCEKSLSGEARDLKERTLAVEIFGRDPRSDLGDDTIVRVGAREVRKRLAQYYVLPEGVESRVRINLPPGSYVPEFRYAETKPDLNISVPVEAAPTVPILKKSRRRMIAAAIVLVSIAGVVAFGAKKWSAANPNEEAFRTFWKPVFDSPEPLLEAVGHPIVYHASARAIRKSEARLPKLPVAMQRPVELAPNEFDGSDLIPVLNQYVGFGDMVAATSVASMLPRGAKSVRVRLANSVQFADFRGGQTLLIGSLTNRWTMELQQGWRFQFFRGPDLHTVIVDTAAASKRTWDSHAKEDGSTLEDYMLLSRIPNSSASGLVIVAAGIKQFGTEAAGRLLADQNQLGGILRKLPPKWESKNIQIVLKTSVIGNTPAEPEMVAWHVW